MKRFEFELTDDLYQQVLRPIREKSDLLRILANAIKLIISQREVVTSIDTEKKIVLYINKMSRLIFSLENKIFSFCFPFRARISQSGVLSIGFDDYFDFDSINSSLLLSVVNRDDLFCGSLENVPIIVLEEIENNEWDDSVDFESFCELIKMLMLFEPGYLRYDYDEERANGDIHPLNHLDIYFSSNATMKLGLEHEVQTDWFIDLLDITTVCKYLKH